MKHYKDPNNNELYAYESDGSQDEFIPTHYIQITDEEANAIRTEKHNVLQQQLQDKLTYAQKRAMEYPPITDYLDGIVKGDQAQIDEYIAKCLAIKAKYPKS